MTLSLNSAIVRIRTADGLVVGAGFLVSERQALTCAHVVAQALGIREENGDVPEGEVSLDFPLVAPEEQLTAKIVCWQPDADVAGLKLDQAPPVGASPNRLVRLTSTWSHRHSRSSGLPHNTSSGSWHQYRSASHLAKQRC